MDASTHDLDAIQDSLGAHGNPIEVAVCWLLSVLDHAEEYPASIENDAGHLQQLRDRLALHSLGDDIPDDGWIQFGFVNQIMGRPPPESNSITLLQALQAKARAEAQNRRNVKPGEMHTVHTTAADRLIAAAITARDHEGENPTNPDPIVIIGDGPDYCKAVFVLRFPMPVVSDA